MWIRHTIPFHASMQSLHNKYFSWLTNPIITDEFIRNHRILIWWMRRQSLSEWVGGELIVCTWWLYCWCWKCLLLTCHLSSLGFVGCGSRHKMADMMRQTLAETAAADNTIIYLRPDPLIQLQLQLLSPSVCWCPTTPHPPKHAHCNINN